MGERQNPVVRPRVSTQLLELAVKLLPLERYPKRLAVIDEELVRRQKSRSCDYSELSAAEAYPKSLILRSAKVM